MDIGENHENNENILKLFKNWLREWVIESLIIMYVRSFVYMYSCDAVCAQNDVHFSVTKISFDNPYKIKGSGLKQ